MNISWLKQWIGFGMGALLVAGCAQNTTEPQDAALPVLEQIEAGLYLEKAESCADLESYLKDMQFEAMKNQVMAG